MSKRVQHPPWHYWAETRLTNLSDFYDGPYRWIARTFFALLVLFGLGALTSLGAQ